MKDLVSSNEVINFLKKNLNEEDVESVFVAGSMPEKLVPESDLDIFVIIKSERKNKFLDNLKKLMDDYIKRNKGIAFSFLHGPLKFKNKGLIHFIIYRGKSNLDEKGKFKDEHISYINDFLKTEKNILGKKISEIYGLKKISKKELKKDEDYIKSKFKSFLDKGIIKCRIWKKVKWNWELLDYEKKLSEYEKIFLTKYYKKRFEK